jgi:hypothetical protein
VDKPIEPLFTITDETGELHIVRIVQTYLQSGSYRTAMVDAADIATGELFSRLPLSKLTPYLSASDVSPVSHSA